MMGMRPIVEIMFGDFMPVAGDQLVNQVAKARYMSGGKAKIPLTIRVTPGAPGLAAAQHSQSPEGWSMAELENYVLPQTQDIVEAARRLVRYTS